MKVAKLVYISLVTRVIIEEDATQEQILTAAIPRLVDHIQNDSLENVELIEDDVECPYDPEMDTPGEVVNI